VTQPGWERQRREAPGGGASGARAPGVALLRSGLLHPGPALLFLALCSLFLHPAGAAAQPGREEVASLAFEGNRVVRSSDLELAILTRSTECVSGALLPFCWAGAGFAIDRYYRSPRSFAQDVARIKVFYYARGYTEATVDTVVTHKDDGAVDITFRIEEGLPIRVDSLEVLGLEEVSQPVADRITQALRRRVGAPLDRIELDAARNAVELLLRNSGYAHADVLLGWYIPPGTRSAALTVDVWTGPAARFGAVTVEGNEELDETVIRRMLPFREGSPYREEYLFEGQRNLYGLELLRRADLEQDLLNEPDSLIPVRVRVAEGDRHRVRMGAGWTTAECLGIESRWASRNFLGGARRLQLRGRVANLLTEQLREDFCPQAGSGEYGRVNWLLGADFTQPFLFSARSALTAGVYAERQSLQDVFIREALGLNLLVSRTVGRGALVSAFYRPSVGRLDAAEVFFCTSYGVCEREAIDALQGTNTLSPIGAVFSQDRVNQLLDPTSGHRLGLEVEHASRLTGSDFRFNRVIAEAIGYQEVGASVLAARIRGGWLAPRPFGDALEGTPGSRLIAHPQSRFYSGGANSVRGFAQNQLGPRVLTVDVGRLIEPREGGASVCTPASIATLTCDAGPLEDGDFSPRPTGGSKVLDGSVELRFPVVREWVQGAAFVDFGQVLSENAELRIGGLELTPGLGLRYLSPIGPLRLDVSYRTVGGQDLRVITSRIRPRLPDEEDSGLRTLGDGDWIVLNELAFLGPAVRFGESQPFSWRRFQVHLSIGQAF